MFLYFDKEGTLKTKIDHGEKLRQGGDMNVTVCLDTDFWSSKKRGDYSLELNALLMTLVFPDETKSISQTADSVSERVFEKLYDSEIVYDLVPGKTYLMYDFFFSAESATPYFGKLRINLTAGNSITTNDYVRFGDESEWISSNPILASGEAGIAKSYDSYGNVTYISKIGKDGLHFTELDGARVQTSELDPVLPPQEGSGYGNYWINTINNTIWLYNESLRTWAQVVTFGVNDTTIEPVTIAFATTEAYVEKTIGFAKAQIDQQISIKYNDIMARFKDVYSKLGMALIKPDWNQQESGKQSYIFNKPNIKNTDVSHIDNLGEETGLFFVKNDSGRANPVYDDYILFQYAGKHQIVWREVSVSFGRTKFGDTWSEWKKNNAEGSLTGNTAPTGELAGVLGQLYFKKDTKDLYYCAKDTEPYEWIPLSRVIKSISTIDSQAGYSEAKGITVQSNEKILYADNSESEAIQTTRDIPVKIGRGIQVKQSDVDPNFIEIYTDLEAKLNENIEKNPSKTYFLIEGNFEQPSIGAHLNPKGWIIDWGDGVVEESVKATPLKHDYGDGFSWHIITMSNMRKLPSYIFDGENSTNKVKKAWIGNGIIDTGDNQSIISESDDIEEVYFADGITSLVFCPLKDCPNLKKIKLPNTLTGIPNYFLGGNSKPLTNELKLLIPKSVTSFEGYYADNQPNLVTIMEGVEPPSASTTTFARYKGSKIIVPKSAVNTYKTAIGWSTQAKKIVYEVDSSDIDKAITDLDVNNIAYLNKRNTFTQQMYIRNNNPYLTLGPNSQDEGNLGKDSLTFDYASGTKQVVTTYNRDYLYHYYYDSSTGEDIEVTLEFPTKSGTLALIEDIQALNIENGEGKDSIQSKYTGEVDTTHFKNTNTGESAAVIGEANFNAGNCATVSGKMNRSSAPNSLIVGLGNGRGIGATPTLDAISGEQLFVFGTLNQISNGNGNVVLGAENTLSDVRYTTIIGRGNIIDNTSLYEGKCVVGRFNNQKPDTMFEVGVGDYNNRVNGFEVYKDGRAKVQTAPKDNDDVVRKLELDTKFDKIGGTVTGDMVVGGNFTVQGRTTTVDSETLRITDKLIEVGKGNTAPLTSPAGLFTPKYDGQNNGGIVYDNTGTAYVGDISLDSNGNVDVNNSDLQPIATRNATITNGNLVKWDSGNHKLVDAGKNVENLVDKLPASLRSQAYVRNANGEDSGLAYTYTNEGNSLALRNASGQLQVSTPLQDNDAANKKFVEDAIAVEVETSLMGA